MDYFTFCSQMVNQMHQIRKVNLLFIKQKVEKAGIY